MAFFILFLFILNHQPKLEVINSDSLNKVLGSVFANYLSSLKVQKYEVFVWKQDNKHFLLIRLQIKVTYPTKWTFGVSVFLQEII